MRSENYTLVLTDQRILFATQTAAMARENARRAKEAPQQQGKGFLGQWGAVVR